MVGSITWSQSTSSVRVRKLVFTSVCRIWLVWPLEAHGLFLICGTIVDVDKKRQNRYGSYIKFFARKHSSSIWREGNVLIWLFLLCYVTKALLFTSGHNQSLIEFFNTETTCIYMLFEKNLVQFYHVKRLVKCCII